MASYTSKEAHDLAAQIVTTVIATGKPVFFGPNWGRNPTEGAEKDAEYINALINSLAQNLRTK